jgi:acetyltransferase-like isoleucine patch superfamily enzyme
MICRESSKPLAAISFDTSTYRHVKHLIATEQPGLDLVQILPEDFLKNPSSDYQYVNLVIKDFSLRKQVSNALDANNLERFTYIDNVFSYDQTTVVGAGSVLFKAVFCYQTTFGKDCIVHGRAAFAENVVVGQGSFFSGGVTIAGHAKIGDFCFVSTNVTVMDHVTVADDVRLLPGLIVKKNIAESGIYYNPYAFKINKLPYENIINREY